MILCRLQVPDLPYFTIMRDLKPLDAGKQKPPVKEFTEIFGIHFGSKHSSFLAIQGSKILVFFTLYLM